MAAVVSKRVTRRALRTLASPAFPATEVKPYSRSGKCHESGEDRRQRLNVVAIEPSVCKEPVGENGKHHDQRHQHQRQEAADLLPLGLGVERLVGWRWS